MPDDLGSIGRWVGKDRRLRAPLSDPAVVAPLAAVPCTLQTSGRRV
jgi:hypothetical protein